MYQDVLPGMTDSHFHAEVMETRDAPVAETFRILREGGASWLIDISIEPGSCGRRRELCAPYSAVRYSSGIHPGSLGRRPLAEMLEDMERELAEDDVVAAGEMGLDWVKMYAPREEQEEAFRRQLELANRQKLPVIIHNRGADRDILRILRETPSAAGGIMHCFSSGPDTLDAALDLGMHISYAGNLTYPRGSEDIIESCRRTPRDRLLLETDAPFLSPQPVRGRPNAPVYLGYTYRRAAELRSTQPESLVSEVRENLESLFNLC